MSRVKVDKDELRSVDRYELLMEINKRTKNTFLAAYQDKKLYEYIDLNGYNSADSKAQTIFLLLEYPDVKIKIIRDEVHDELYIHLYNEL